MADYHSVLQRAIANLPQNTGQARREIYDKARKALVRQLESFDPPLPPSEITAQRLALEEAIRRIEGEVMRRTPAARPAAPAERLPMPAAPAPRPAAPRPAAPPAPAAEVRAPVEPVAPVAAPAPALPAEPDYPPAAVAPPAPAPAPQPVAAPVVQAPVELAPPAPVEPPAAPPVRVRRSEPPRTEPTLAPEPVVRAPAERRPAATAPQPAANESWAYSEDGGPLPPTDTFDPRRDPAEDEAYYHADQDRAPPRTTPKTTSRGEPGSPRTVRAPVDRAFGGRDPQKRRTRSGQNRMVRLVALAVVVLALLGASVGAVYLLSPSGETPAPAQTADAQPPADTSAPAAGTDQPDTSGKVTDRLEEDVKRVPTRRIVTTEPESQPEDQTATDTAAVPTVPPPPAPEAPPEPANTMSATGDRAILYEEGAAQGSRGSAAVGKVSWSLVRESYVDGPKEAMVRAKVTIPERKVSVGLLFRQNHDPALPASYLVEITYSLPDNFPGGGISNVPGIIMKPSEDARGDALVGASARVSDGLFWIALAQGAADVARNDALLRDRNWIDIPMLYANGRRAILTIEKGPEGTKALTAAIEAWNKAAAQ